MGSTFDDQTSIFDERFEMTPADGPGSVSRVPCNRSGYADGGAFDGGKAQQVGVDGIATFAKSTGTFEICCFVFI